MLRQNRSAFTLVEMLVAMALIIFIMTILSEAFVAGLETFRQLKAVGDMNEKLRTVTTAVRRDLIADHFEARRRISDPSFWLQGQVAQVPVQPQLPPTPANGQSAQGAIAGRPTPGRCRRT